MRVWIQRGHCFRSRGSTGTAGSGTSEQAYVNDIANRAAVLLRERGHHVKVALADQRLVLGYDAFVALHCDGSISRTASGASVGYRTTSGRAVARTWKTRYAARGWPHGFRGDNYTTALERYYGTSWAATAGIRHAFILEHGFLTNPREDGAFLTSARGRTVAAMALADTIEELAGGQPLPDAGGDEEEETMQRSKSARGDGAALGVQELCNDWLDAYQGFREAKGWQPSSWATLALDDAPGTKTINRVQAICVGARPGIIPDPSDNSSIHWAHVGVVIFEAARLRQATGSIKREEADRTSLELIEAQSVKLERMQIMEGGDEPDLTRALV